VTARAIWQGTLTIQKHQCAVKLYSAVVDPHVHFHLLHTRDHARLQQHMVDPETKRPVPPDDTLKAFEVEPGLYVVLTSEDIDRSVPEANRDISVSRFVPLQAIDPQLFDRPYYLGPADGAETDYFALAQAIDRKQCVGIASWVMRKHSYVGALVGEKGHLLLITLRHADEVIPLSELEPPQGRPLESKEKVLAEKLIDALSGHFQPVAYHDEYHERVRELVDAKRAGKKLKPKRVAPRRRAGSLASSLEASLKRVTASRSA
jgi:DNA end-binding protein Ku